jgi:sterol desaturase/sphingolipid hydroxylase (fatty acid hydroxylase superfamily)
MRRSRVLDSLTRTHPSTPVVIYLPVVVVLAAYGFSRIPLVLAAGLTAAGYLVWTLVEYWGHRLAFHYRPRSAWGRQVHWWLHGVHHRHPDDARRLVFPPVGSLPILALLLAGTWPAIGGAAWACVGAGFIGGYLVHDMTHLWLHQGRPRGRIGRGMRRRHLRHHARDGRTGFGVSAPYWDRVFGKSS